jgi:mannose-6-phosphate isomerase
VPENTIVALSANQPETFYRGAGRIAEFREVTGLPDRPEDWVGSTTSRFGLAPSGLSALPDGRLLVDAIAADPAWWLGAAHRVAYGDNPGFLVKLLDAGQRLPLHVHPDRRFASAHLASPYGKTEAWVIVSAAPDAVVHLGFARDVPAEELASWVTGQRTDDMLAATHRVRVRAGDAVLCPAGLPHAIGPGILLVEIQEPTDFSVLLEYEAFGLPDGHLGLGYDLALSCVDRSGWGNERLAALRGPTGSGRMLPAAAEPFFAADRLIGPEAELDPAFAVVVVVSGTGTLTGEHDRLPVRRGDTLLVPHAAGPLMLTGDARAVRLRAPRP